MITKIIRAHAALVTNEAGIKSQVIYLDLKDAVEHTKKVNNTNIVVKDHSIKLSWKQFLHDCADMLPEQYVDLPASDVCQLLEAAPVDLNITNYKAGDKYVDENGVESAYSNAGSDIRIADLRLSQLTMQKFDTDKKNFNAIKIAAMAKLAAIEEMGLDPYRMTIPL